MDESKKTFKFDPATQILHEMLLLAGKYRQNDILIGTAC
jgi:hypothetical protein